MINRSFIVIKFKPLKPILHKENYFHPHQTITFEKNNRILPVLSTDIYHYQTIYKFIYLHHHITLNFNNP